MFEQHDARECSKTADYNISAAATLEPKQRQLERRLMTPFMSERSLAGLVMHVLTPAAQMLHPHNFSIGDSSSRIWSTVFIRLPSNIVRER